MATLLTTNPFQHDSERRVAEQLRTQLTSAACLVSNYVLPSRFGSGEFDLIAVLAEGIVAIEIKHWGGAIVALDRMVEFQNGYRVPNPFPGLSYKTKRLRTRLMQEQLIGSDVPVGHALIHTGSLTWPDDARTDHFIFELRTITTEKPFLQALSPFSAPSKRLSPAQCKAIATALAQPSSGAETWTVSDYLILEEASSTSHARQFLGRSAHLYNREVMLRCWELDPAADSSVSKHILELTSEASALARLERHRCRAIPLVYDAFPDPANFNVFWLIHEYVGRSTLQQMRSTFLQDAAFRAFVVREIDEALRVLQQERVVHRNVAADIVYISEARDRVLLGGFEFSASENDATIRRSVRNPGDRPPEVAQGAFASHAGDIYAAAQMILELLRPGEQPSAKRVKAVRNERLRRAIEQCLNPEPARRPADLKMLIGALEGSLS